MKTSKKHVQTVISENFPFNMTYQRGTPVKAGRGRMKRKTPRTVGASPDRLFSVILYGPAGAVRKVEFMNPWSDKIVLARNMVPIRAVIADLCPDWDEDADQWLTTSVPRIADEQKLTRNGVTLHRLDVYDNSVLFVTVE